jgi:hypothetical protein
MLYSDRTYNTEILNKRAFGDVDGLRGGGGGVKINDNEQRLAKRTRREAGNKGNEKRSKSVIEGGREGGEGQ